MKCRFCHTPLNEVFLDLGTAPPSNAFLTADDLAKPETWFPLKLYTCPNCHLVQADEIESHAAIFSSEYAYFSSYSRSWLAHAELYVAQVAERLCLGPQSLVVEIASNDGYLLQYVKARDIPCVGIEPTAGTAQAARARDIETIEEFFGDRFAHDFVASRCPADLIAANNVLAHVPDLNDFVEGIHTALAPAGVATLEFPHLMQLIDQHQFDTIYHEHFSYFSFHTVQRIFAAHGLRLWDVEELPTHGGSLRLWSCRDEAAYPNAPAVAALLTREAAAGMETMDYYRGFQAKADAIKNAFLAFLLDAKRAGKLVVGYGAAAKGNTLMNYAGVRSDLVHYVADASPHKQGHWLPGSRIPVVAEARIRATRPDYVVILPWNLHAEITAQLTYIQEWGGKFVTAIPSIQVD